MPGTGYAGRQRHNAFVFPLAVVAAAIILFISEASYQKSRSALDEATGLYSDAFKAQALMRRMLDAETGQRGYLLTGRPEYLDPYRGAVKAIPPLMAAMRRGGGQADDLQPFLERLDSAVGLKLSEMDQTIRLYDGGERDAAGRLMLTDAGKRSMEAIRAIVEQMFARENMRAGLARTAMYKYLLVDRLGIALMIALCLAALYLYLAQSRGLQDNEQAQKRAIQAERDHLETEVVRRTAELTDLSRHLLTAREDERMRLARELHDELGALLTAAKLDAARIKNRIAPLSAEAAERLGHLNEVLNSVIALKRRIIEDLRPTSLSNLGLIAALRILARQFEERAEVKVVCDFSPVVLQEHSELTVYRLVQEALTNISKYAKAKSVHISLGAHDGVVEIAVVDDGVGFDPGVRKASVHGLIGMRHRVAGQGGTLTVQSAPGSGTRVRATWPLGTPA